MLSQAFISAEDKRFYIHGGIDFIGVAQAIAAKFMNPIEQASWSIYHYTTGLRVF